MLTVHTTSFLYKNEGKNIRFCPLTLILLITNTEPKISVFVRSHCFGSVKLIAEYWNVFENLRFCGVFVQINVNIFPKTEVFLSIFVQKRCSVNGALDFEALEIDAAVLGRSSSA